MGAANNGGEKDPQSLLRKKMMMNNISDVYHNVDETRQSVKARLNDECLTIFHFPCENVMYQKKVICSLSFYGGDRN